MMQCNKAIICSNISFSIVTIGGKDKLLRVDREGGRVSEREGGWKETM